MSANKKRARTTPVSANKAQPLQIDEDFLCLICTELLEETKQVACCGALFCGACIDLWMNRQAAGDGHGCPQCRAALVKESIVVDVRSDRKSAAQPRRCPFHEDHDCAFVGTRQEVAEHKLTCPCDPDLCNSERCKSDKAKLDALLESEKAKWENKLAKQEETIRKLTKTVNDNSAALRLSLLSVVWLSPEDILKKACGLKGVTILSVNASGKYTVTAKKSKQHVSVEDVDIEFNDANCNVSLFCHRPRYTTAHPAAGGWRLKVVITLISFDPATVPDLSRSLVLEKEHQSLGYPTWLAPAEFKKYEKDGKFALGWTVTAVP